MNIALAFITLFSCVHLCFGGNVLFASEMPSPSHKIFNFALAEALAKHGHNVTFLGPPILQKLGKGLKNFHPVYLQEGEIGDLQPEILASASTLDGLMRHYDYNFGGCIAALKSDAIEALLRYPEDFKFDLIILDNTNTNCLLPFIQRFKYPPAISVTAFLLPYHLSLAFGNDVHPAYIPSYIVKLSSDMNFIQRIYNYLWLNLDLLLRYYYLTPEIERMARERFGDNIDSLSELQDHISLLLCNLEPAYHHPQPLPPNVIPVGGLHVKQTKPLSKDVQKVLDNATDGAILFALGSNIRSDKIRPKEIEAILGAFSKIKQTVIWKFESNWTEFSYTVPNNVHTFQWIPQQDILGHPNTRLFISHGGALSTIEAAYFGVPVLGIPFIVDQFINTLMIEEKKYGLLLKYEDITETNMLAKITKLLDDKRYTKRMKEISRRMRDHPQTAIERALFWTEFVMRHNGSSFLNTRARKMSRFASTSADVQLFMLLLSLVLALFLAWILSRARAIFRRTLKHSSKEKRN